MKDIGICISASRAELGKGENRFEPSVSRIWQKQNVLVYVCDILYMCFSLYYLYLVCHRAPTHGGLGCRGRSPLRQSSTKLTLSTERGERGGAAAAPAGRRLPQEARAARSRGRAKTRCRRHALKRWFGSGEVSSDGLQGRSTCRERSPSLYKKSEQAMYSLLRHEKKKQF